MLTSTNATGTLALATVTGTLAPSSVDRDQKISAKRKSMNDMFLCFELKSYF
jgi:hypothetical protein